MLEAFFEYVRQPVLAISKTHEVAYINPYAEQFFHIKASVEQGKSIDHFLKQAKFLPYCQQQFQHALTQIKETKNAGPVRVENLSVAWRLAYEEEAERIIVLFELLDGASHVELGGQSVSLQFVIDNIPANIYWMNEKREYLGCNRHLARAVDAKSPQHLIGKRAEDVLPELYVAKIIQADAKVIESGERSVYEQEGTSRKGEKTTYLSHKVPLMDDSGKVCGLLGSAIDIGEVKRLQRERGLKVEQLKEMAMLTKDLFGTRSVFSKNKIVRDAALIRQFFNYIINALPATIYWMDRKRRYLGCNELAAKLAGFESTSSIIGKTIYDFCPEAIAQATDELDKLVMEEDRAFYREEEGLDEYGKTAVYMSSKNPLRDDTGEVIGLVGISLDITQRKKAETALKRAKTVAENANKAKSDFLAMMTHELRTPLNIILGMTRIMQQEKLPEDKREHYMQTIFNSGQALLHLINNILDFSKAQAGKLELHESVFSPREVLQQLRDELGYKAAEKKLQCLFEVGDSVPQELYGDDQRLRQVLYNLVDNALKYTQEGSVKVSLAVESNQANVVLLNVFVEDTGIGIPKERLKQVFNAFSQVRSQKHDEYSRKYGGVGLGLAIVSRMIKVLKGKLTVDSEVGKGTRFSLHIPFAQVNEDVMQHEEPMKNVPDTFPDLRVLLVEDNVLNQKVVTHMLNTLKCCISVASNGDEALTLLRNKSFDVVLMDLSLPDMSGLEITQTYRAEEKDQHLPIIALTAHAHSDDEEKSLAAGMDGFLVKPLFPEKLREVLYTISCELGNGRTV